MEDLEKTNPSSIWLKVRLTSEFRLASGHAIVVRFDVASTVGEKKMHFTGDMVWERWGHAMLGEHAELPARYLKPKQAVIDSENLAEMINDGLIFQAEAIINHCELSFSALVALKNKRFADATQILIQLGRKLENFEPSATNVGWGQWLMDCSKYMKNDGK